MTKKIIITLHPFESTASGSMEILISCRNTITRDIVAKKSPKEILDRAVKELPGLEQLHDFLPKPKRDALDFVNTFFTVLNVIIALYSVLKPSEVNQIIINQTIQNYYFLKTPSQSLPSSVFDRQKRHTEKKKQQYSKKRKPLPNAGNKKTKL
jgi:hypothetical protein